MLFRCQASISSSGPLLCPTLLCRCVVMRCDAAAARSSALPWLIYAMPQPCDARWLPGYAAAMPCVSQRSRSRALLRPAFADHCPAGPLPCDALQFRCASEPSLSGPWRSEPCGAVLGSSEPWRRPACLSRCLAYLCPAIAMLRESCRLSALPSRCSGKRRRSKSLRCQAVAKLRHPLLRPRGAPICDSGHSRRKATRWIAPATDHPDSPGRKSAGLRQPVRASGSCLCARSSWTRSRSSIRRRA